MLTEIPIKISYPRFFPADVSIILYSLVRWVSEKFSSGRTGKVARPNMDIVDVFFSLLVHRPWSMQRFSFRYVGQEWEFTFILCSVLHSYTAQTFVELVTRSLMFVFLYTEAKTLFRLNLGAVFVRGWFEVASTIQCVILINTIFGCLSVLVSCKARPHSGEGKLKTCA